MILFAQIYRGARGYDCTNGGLSSRVSEVKIYFNENNIFEWPELPEDIAENSLIVKADLICGGMKTIRAFTIENGKPQKRGMFGGNFVFTSDSRFPKLGDFGEPIQIHDRFED